MENTFKSSVFGGFNRDDVIRYIEKTALESKQQIESLEQESDGLCRENAELRDKLAAAERERDKLAESYDTASGAQEALKKGLTAAQETITELRAQLEESAQRAAFAQKEHERLREAQKAEHEREMQKLQAELETLRAQAEEYGRVKAHIADIELSARERADALDAATRANCNRTSPPARSSARGCLQRSAIPVRAFRPRCATQTPPCRSCPARSPRWKASSTSLKSSSSNKKQRRSAFPSGTHSFFMIKLRTGQKALQILLNGRAGHRPPRCESRAPLPRGAE